MPIKTIPVCPFCGEDMEQKVFETGNRPKIITETKSEVDTEEPLGVKVIIKKVESFSAWVCKCGFLAFWDGYVKT